MTDDKIVIDEPGLYRIETETLTVFDEHHEFDPEVWARVGASLRGMAQAAENCAVIFTNVAQQVEDFQRSYLNEMVSSEHEPPRD